MRGGQGYFAPRCRKRKQGNSLRRIRGLFGPYRCGCTGRRRCACGFPCPPERGSSADSASRPSWSFGWRGSRCGPPSASSRKQSKLVPSHASPETPRAHCPAVTQGKVNSRAWWVLDSATRLYGISDRLSIRTCGTIRRPRLVGSSRRLAPLFGRREALFQSEREECAAVTRPQRVAPRGVS